MKNPRAKEGELCVCTGTHMPHYHKPKAEKIFKNALMEKIEEFKAKYKK